MWRKRPGDRNNDATARKRSTTHLTEFRKAALVYSKFVVRSVLALRRSLYKRPISKLLVVEPRIIGAIQLDLLGECVGMLTSNMRTYLTCYRICKFNEFLQFAKWQLMVSPIDVHMTV